jgi:hypothetical protein
MPQEQHRLFQDQPPEFKTWLANRFQSALTDFDDSDDFNYVRLFGDVSQYCFSGRRLYLTASKYCEDRLRAAHPPAYCGMRVCLALHNSPLSRIDPLQPLSILVVQAISRDADRQNIAKAATIGRRWRRFPCRCRCSP